jgi:hypothetical protein
MKQRLYTRRGFRFALTVFALLMAITLIVFLPLTFTRVSSIAKLYRTNSALVSSLALVGVAVSLLYQARAGRTAREQAIRSLQQQLIKMEMDDPSLMTAIGAPWGLPIPAESDKIRDHLYVHMWSTFWAGNYVVGELSAEGVRGMARAELLNSKAGRTYWASVRERVLTTNRGKYLRFCRIVDSEYQAVIAGNVPVVNPVRITNNSDDSTARRKRQLKCFTTICTALATGVLVGRKLGQRRYRLR